jgi:hypothetical protein
VYMVLYDRKKVMAYGRAKERRGLVTAYTGVARGDRRR